MLVGSLRRLSSSVLLFWLLISLPASLIYTRVGSVVTILNVVGFQSAAGGRWDVSI